MSIKNLSDNLRLLCSYKKSISNVCRDLKINRQQFNKYLSGKTAPSSNNLRKICDYFGVEEHEIMLPNQDFNDLISARPTIEYSPSNNTSIFEEIEAIILHSNIDLPKYEGAYYIYYHSTSFPKKILKGYGVLYENNGKHFLKWIERLSLVDSDDQTGFLYKIKGVVIGLGNRIFISGYEQVLKNELAHLILFPTYKNKVVQLSGLMLGVSGSDSREPVCQRVFFSYIGKAVNHKEAMKSCGIYDEDSEDLDPQVRSKVKNGIVTDDTVFRGLPL